MELDVCENQFDDFALLAEKPVPAGGVGPVVLWVEGGEEPPTGVGAVAVEVVDAALVIHPRPRRRVVSWDRKWVLGEHIVMLMLGLMLCWGLSCRLPSPCCGLVSWNRKVGVV